MNDMNLSDPDRRIAKQQLVYKVCKIECQAAALTCLLIPRKFDASAATLGTPWTLVLLCFRVLNMHLALQPLTVDEHVYGMPVR